MSGGEVERISFLLNGRQLAVAGDGATPLLGVLRNRLGLKGTRFGCGAEQCGACFVLVDGRATAACTTPLSAVRDKSVTTVEGLGRPEAPHPLQRAFIAEQAAQCGYCTSGMLISGTALLTRSPRPSEAEDGGAPAGSCRRVISASDRNNDPLRRTAFHCRQTGNVVSYTPASAPLPFHAAHDPQ